MFINNLHKISFRFIQFVIGFVFLTFISACGNNNANTPPNKTVTSIPSVLQKLTLNGGTLKAFVTLDGNVNNPIPMEIDAAGEGTASVTIPGLSREPHNVLITYEYTDDVGTVTLATILDRVDLTQGSFELNVPADEYDLNSYDENQNGISNAEELVAGTDFRLRRGQLKAILITSVPPVLNVDLLVNGELRAFVVLDGNTDAQLDMQIDSDTGLAEIVLENLTPNEHTLVVIFEYVDSAGNKLELATINQNVNLVTSGANFDFGINDLVLTDLDGDGLSNFSELLISTDPAVSAIPLVAAIATLRYEATKVFSFTWEDVKDATFYRLIENRDGSSGFEKFEDDIAPGLQSLDLIVPLHARLNTSYILQSCNNAGCINGETLNVDVPALVNSIGFIKSDGALFVPPLPGEPIYSAFARSVSLSDDGLTLAVTMDGDFTAPSGVYVFVLSNSVWAQQAIIVTGDARITVDLNADGSVLAIGSQNDDSDSVGINGDRINKLARNSGAVFIYVRDTNSWIEQAYIKASNTGEGDFFGASVSLSDDGKTLAVGAFLEDSKDIGVFESNSTLITAAQADDSVIDSGAVYLYNFDALAEIWKQTAYIKSSNTDSDDRFGRYISLAGDGLTLAIGALRENRGQVACIIILFTPH